MSAIRDPYAYLRGQLTGQIDDAIQLIGETTGTSIDPTLLDLNDHAVYESLAGTSPAQTIFLSPWPKSADESPANLAELTALCERLMPDFRGSSHIRRHAELGYLEMWLRLRYPAHFLAAGLSRDSGISSFRASRLNAFSRSSIRVLPPSINRSLRSATVVGGEVLLGLDAIQALPPAGIDFILQARAGLGAFESLEELDRNVGVIDQGTGVFSHLVKSGALDCTGETRASMLHQADARYFGTDAALAHSHGEEDRDGSIVVHEFEALGCSVTFDLLRSEPADTSRAGASGVVWKVVDEPEPDGLPSRRVSMITSDGIGSAQFLGEAVERFNQLTAPFQFIRVSGSGFGWMGAPARSAAAAYAPENGLVRR